MEDRWQELKYRLAEVSNLRHASAVLGWDQQTCMPSRGAPARADQLATLDKIAHERFICDEIGELLDALEPEVARLDYVSDEASLIRVARRDYDKARRVPASLVERLSRTCALGIEAWGEARAKSDFRIFQSHLEKIVDLEIELANRLGYAERIYDALLDQYEPEMTSAQVASIFADLRGELKSLARRIEANASRVDDACLSRFYDPQKQWDLGLEVIKQFGFDFTRGRQDKSLHPFTTGFSLGDVRITTRVEPNYLPSALFGTLHECGHALYDQGYKPELENTPLEGGASLGVHESQSRLWENLVGRSRGFWRHYFPHFRQQFPDALDDQDAESFYRAVNRVKPTPIRVEADEVTYNLHVMVRFDLENDLVEGKLKVADAPEAWRAKMREYLGLAPSNDAEGVLQDIHWAMGSLGYFPTYSIGNLFSVQLFERALRDDPEIPSAIERGDFRRLLDWLRLNVHQHGRKFTLDELARRVTGESLQTRSYLSYLHKKYGEIYSL